MGQRSPEAERQESHHLYPLHEPGDGSNKPVGLELEQVDFEPHLERGIPPEAVDALLKHIEEEGK
jgi:hypothetical protein